MPCVSLKHRRIYREQILPCIKIRVNAEKTAKSFKNKQKLAQKVQIVNQNIDLSANIQSQIASHSNLSTIPAQKSKKVTSPVATNPAMTATPQTTPVAHKDNSAKPQLMVEGQEISLRHPELNSSQPSTVLTGFDQLNAELSNLDATQPTTVSSQNVSRENSLRAFFRSQHARPSREDLINAESRLGASIFGPIPAGHRREFFHDQRNIWIWHEGWYDEAHAYHNTTVRYEVYPSGVYKKISAGNYQRLESWELDNFRQAARTYLHLIKQNLYQFA